MPGQRSGDARLQFVQPRRSAPVDTAGEALLTRFYAISCAEDPADLTGRMMADIRRARAQHARMPVGVVQDAAPELWMLLRGAQGRGETPALARRG